MSITLFDDLGRNYDGPALYAEPTFNYLNRSARPESAEIRARLEEWFATYPIEAQAEFRNRFRSSNDLLHQGAFFELFLQALLCQMNYRVTIHPIPDEKIAKRPDFLVTRTGETSFYLEATLATGTSQRKLGQQAIINSIYDQLNDRVQSPNFFLGMKLRGAPQSQPPASKMATFLQRNLDTLEADGVSRQAEVSGLEQMPRWHYEHDGWEIEFFPIPKSLKARGKPGVRPVSLHMEGFRLANTSESIRTAIEDKATRYGELDLPYIVAVNVTGDFIDNIDILEALFGKEQFLVNLDNPDDIEMTRVPDGAWTSRAGPRNTRVSAVLLLTRLNPWTISNTPVRIIHNPYARRPCLSTLRDLPKGIIDGDHMQWHNGMGLAQLFP